MMATDKPRSPELAALCAPLDAPPLPRKGETGTGNYPRLKSGKSLATGREAGGHASGILANRRRRLKGKAK